MEKSEKHFFNAAAKGDIKKLKALLKNGVDVNAEDEKGHTALVYAARNGKLKTVEFLLYNEANGNPEAVEIALTAAFKNGHKSTVELLRRYNMSLEIRLCGAVDMWNTELVAKSLSEGADPDSQEYEYSYPVLVQAADEGRSDIVKLLLDYGANVNIQDVEFGQSALICAADKGDKKDCKTVA